MKAQATEENDLQTALGRLPQRQDFLRRLLNRIRPHFPLEPPARVLDIGAAQGVDLTCFMKLGFEAEGVEPWAPAIEVSREVSRSTGYDTKIVPGTAEDLPLESESFDFVQAYSVLEHVDDPDACFREAYRVLKPGGAFFFETTSAICPRQEEIARFPLFPWYPPPLQRAIMNWAKDKHPDLVGGTTRPAVHWFKHRKVRRKLEEVGFVRIVDRWQLRTEESGGLRGALINACASNRLVRLAGDIAIPSLDYLAIKG